MATVILEGDYRVVREIMFGPDNHDAHVREYHWHLRVLDAEERAYATALEVDRINRMHRTALDMARAMGAAMGRKL